MVVHSAPASEDAVGYPEEEEKDPYRHNADVSKCYQQNDLFVTQHNYNQKSSSHKILAKI